VENTVNKVLKSCKGIYWSYKYDIILVMPVTSLESCLILILFLHSNIGKSYKEVKAGELFYFNNPFLYLNNK